MRDVFFLGGMDTEMSRIKELLAIHNKKFFCKDLPLNNAKASCYKDELANLSGDEIAVLIELEIDCQVPENSIVIDPAGENWDKSALFQVCDMIGHRPINIDLYISANDHGWIPAMYAVGASKEDVMTIRQAERMAQGITVQDEEEAIEAIDGKEEINGVTVVHLKHIKCIPVTDRLYDPAKPQNLLIISDCGEINYYGNGFLCQILKEDFGGRNGGSGLGKKDGTAFWSTEDYNEAAISFILNYKTKE